jgi:hypothetical protein
MQQGISIAESNDVYISWLNIQQTITPVDPEVRRQINDGVRLFRKKKVTTTDLLGLLDLLDLLDCWTYWRISFEPIPS